MSNEPGGWKIPQERETLAQVGQSDAFTWRYAYYRAQDSRTAGEPGQDYLTFCQDGKRLAFALCDGVSQSFYGELAARLLGDSLLGWLWKSLPAGMDPRKLKVSLTTLLGALTRRGKELVETHSLPADLPPMLRDVLDMKRIKGSEATFVCGRIDLPGRAYPKGRAVLMWMGDSRVRLWDTFGELSAELGDTFHTRERWSTHKGMIGEEPHFIVLPVAQKPEHTLTRLMVYSDGAPELNTLEESPSMSLLNDIIKRANQAATSDDLSYLEIWLGADPSRVDEEGS